MIKNETYRSIPVLDLENGENRKPRPDSQQKVHTMTKRVRQPFELAHMSTMEFHKPLV